MKDNEFVTLVTRHLSGEASDQEIGQLNKLMDEDRYRSLFEFVKEKWDKVQKPKTDTSRFSYSRGRRLLIDKIKKHDPEFSLTHEQETKVIPMYRHLMKVAASIVLIITAGILVYKVSENFESNVKYKVIEKATSAGQRTPLLLGDNSKVNLNARSRLKYKEPFADKKRELELDGEAYFKVAKNPEKPFIVSVKGLKVEVLGTEFNVKSFEEGDHAYISLIEGSVKVMDSQENTLDTLKPGEQLIFDNKSEQFKVTAFDELKVTGWKDNVLVIDNEPLFTVIEKLEDRYGVRIKIKDEPVGKCVIKATLKKESLNTFLKMLKHSFAIDYKVKNKEVSLSGKGCP